MKIAIDLRCLLPRNYSGVGWYTVNLLKSLFKLDQKNQYILLFNQFKNLRKDSPTFDFPNVKQVVSHIPNKFLTLSGRFLDFPKIDHLIPDRIDIFFIPLFKISPVSNNCKKVITCHDLSFEYFPKFSPFRDRIFNKLGPKFETKKSDHIIAVSHSTFEDLLRLYNVSPDKVSVIYEGVEDRFRPIDDYEYLDKVKKKYNLPHKFILFLGNLDLRKNILGLIEAYKELRKSLDVKLVLAGQPSWGYKEKSLKLKVQNSKLKDDIKFLGYVDERDKPALYNLASIFCFPSFYEGFGLPPLEAMACGTPVITSNNSSLPEIVGDAGLMINPYDTDELGQTMETLIRDESLRNKLKEKCLSQADKFRWDEVAEKTLEVFEKVANH